MDLLRWLLMRLGLRIRFAHRGSSAQSSNFDPGHPENGIKV